MCLFIKNALLQTALLFLFITFFASVNISAQPVDDSNFQALLDQVQSKHQEMMPKLRGYTFVLKLTEQELDDKGGVTRRLDPSRG